MENIMENKMNDYNKIIEFLSGEMAENEKNNFEVWLNDSPDNRKEFEEIQGIWDKTGDPSLNSEIDIDKGWDSISSRIDDKKEYSLKAEPGTVNRKVLYNFLKVAAILVLAFILWKSYDNNNEMLIISSFDNDNYIHTLPDGSTVALRAWTTIEYPEHFEKDLREVYIKGEASFKISPDPDANFIIQTGNARVEVLGTTFNLNAYEYDDKVEIEVQEGKVLFYNNLDPGNPLASKVDLGAGEKAIFTKSTNSIVKSYNQNIWLLYP